MWNTIANFRENISQMASEVLENVEEEDDLPSVSSPLRSQEPHFRRKSDRFTRSRRNYDSEDRNGVASFEDHESSLLAFQKKYQDLEAREQELLSQMRSKEQAYRELDDIYHNSQAQLEKLTLEMERLKLELKEHKEEATGKKQGEEAERVDKLQKELETRDETIFQLQESLSDMKKERDELQAEREQSKTFKAEPDPDDNVQTEMLKTQAQQVDVLLEKLKATEETFEKERTELRSKLEAVTMEKDKAVSNLSRLKQHLLEKENADSEKMDQDSEQIAMLETKVVAANARVLQLEQALSQALNSQADTSKRLSEELQASKMQIESLNSKTNQLYAALEAKDLEIANLQMALGQYYAESDAKERLQRELHVTKEELRKSSADLETAKKTIDAGEVQKKELMERLQVEEKKGIGAQKKMEKFQEDMLRLRRALEESMIRLNRMSSDSDYSVDRRIVIKLLVTYFEKAHSREVLDLMARMLGFSEDDKRRVGLAHQNAGKPGVVRSVLGLPGRVVGGLLGSGTDASSTFSPGTNQSFADLWIDFLLKESEERDRKEREAELAAASQQQSAEPTRPNTKSTVSTPKSTQSTEVNALSSPKANGYDLFRTDFASIPSSSSTSSLDIESTTKGHRRVYSRP